LTKKRGLGIKNVLKNLKRKCAQQGKLCLSFNQEVVGSIPAALTNKIKELAQFERAGFRATDVRVGTLSAPRPAKGVQACGIAPIRDEPALGRSTGGH
jgi:hypothetical protein